MIEKLALDSIRLIHLRLNCYEHLLPETRNSTHTRWMCLAHALLYLLRISVYNQLSAFRQRQICPTSFKNMRERQEVYDAIFLTNGHTFVVRIHRSTILSVRKHHAFTFSCRATGIENVTKIHIVCLMPKPFYLTLSRQLFT